MQKKMYGSSWCRSRSITLFCSDMLISRVVFVNRTIKRLCLPRLSDTFIPKDTNQLLIKCTTTITFPQLQRQNQGGSSAQAGGGVNGCMQTDETDWVLPVARNQSC